MTRLQCGLTLVTFLAAFSAASGSGKIPAVHETATGRVVAITDGDTVRVLIERDGLKEELKVRLEGIDAPESKQAFGQRSKQHLSDLVFGETIELRVTGKDRYGRTLGKLFIDGRDINRQMITDGMAWHYDYFNSEPEYAAAQVESRGLKRGLWSESEQVAPWEFRKKPAKNQ